MASQKPPVALVMRVILIGPAAAEGAADEAGAGAAEVVAGAGAADDDVAAGAAGVLDAAAGVLFLLLQPVINTAAVARTARALYRDDTFVLLLMGFPTCTSTRGRVLG
jgi:hypothetical protein